MNAKHVVHVYADTRPHCTYCVCGQIFFDVESVRPSYLCNWIENKMQLSNGI